MKILSILFLTVWVAGNTLAASSSPSLETCFAQHMYASLKIGRGPGLDANPGDRDHEMFDSVPAGIKANILNTIKKNRHYDRFILLTKIFHECLYPGRQESFDSINALQFCAMQNDLLVSIAANRGFGIKKKEMPVYLIQNEPHTLPISHLARKGLIEKSIEEVFATPYAEVYWEKGGKVKNSFLYKKMAQCINAAHIN